jgi:hypothetical protein
MNPRARRAPTTCASRNAGTEEFDMPAGESVNILDNVTAGFANEVDDVKKLAAKIQSGINFQTLFSVDVRAK